MNKYLQEITKVFLLPEMHTWGREDGKNLNDCFQVHSKYFTILKPNYICFVFLGFFL